MHPTVGIVMYTGLEESRSQGQEIFEEGLKRMVARILKVGGASRQGIVRRDEEEIGTKVNFI